MAKIIAIDFDGVLHSYSSGWTGPEEALDPPVPGAEEFLCDLIADSRFDPCIYSSRSRQEGGIKCMREWIERHMPRVKLNKLRFPTMKPAAFMTLDDRAICFEGTFPSLETVDAFKPWNKR